MVPGEKIYWHNSPLVYIIVIWRLIMVSTILFTVGVFVVGFIAGMILKNKVYGWFGKH